MRLEDEFDESPRSKGVNTAIAVSIVAILAVVLAILVANNKKDTSSSNTVTSQSVSVEPEVIYEYAKSPYEGTNLSPKDLDFYQLYPKDNTLNDSNVIEPSNELSKEDATKKQEEKDFLESKKDLDESLDQPQTDGEHTRIVHKDGTEEWVSISKYIAKNSYDYTHLQNRDGVLEYYEEDNLISYFGVEISDDQDYVDFVKLQKSGVDFVMLRLGVRGYKNGLLALDDYFKDNIRRAIDAGLDVGVYFTSQAITPKEAEEEADFVISNLKDYELTYPVVFMEEYSTSETLRTDVLTKVERTDVCRVFLEKIRDAGYKPMICGSKCWLISDVELSKLVSQYDIWLMEEEDLPTFPYLFTMWQYNKKGSVSGISGNVPYLISFFDYSIR